MRRRAVLRGGIGLIGTATSGCLGGRLGDLPGNRRTAVDEEYPLRIQESSLTRDQFLTHAGTLHERYASAGIWGQAEAEPDHDLSFAGAWLEEHPFDGFVIEHTAALFRLPDTVSDNRTPYQLLLWAGIDEFTQDVRPHTLRVGVDIEDDTGEMGVYSPGSTVTGEYTIDIGRMDTQTIVTEMPLPAGTLGPVATETAVGESGGFALEWDGDHDGQVAIAGSCELRLDPTDVPDITWDIQADVALPDS